MASEKTVQPETLRYSADAGNAELSALCGPLDENLRQIETILNVRVSRRGDVFRVTGELEAARRAVTALAALMTRVKSTGEELSVDDIQWHFVGHDDEYRSGAASDPEGAVDDVDLKVRRRDLQGRTPNQRLYLKAIMGHDISFGVGPAGTGKTFLAVAAAVDAFERGTVERIVLTRPAVEAGERLGFLPGDLTQKVDPYLRPLYDALYDFMGVDSYQKLLERGVVEVAPLAYMRGRTLSDSFIILDEAQNTTSEQMKMFLTRLGFHSKVVVTGDITQTDLPYGKKSGLAEAIEILKDIPEIGMVHLTHKDVVRHELVQTIVKAYDAYYHREAEGQRP